MHRIVKSKLIGDLFGWKRDLFGGNIFQLRSLGVNGADHPHLFHLFQLCAAWCFLQIVICQVVIRCLSKFHSLQVDPVEWCCPCKFDLNFINIHKGIIHHCGLLHRLASVGAYFLAVVICSYQKLLRPHRSKHQIHVVKGVCAFH